MGKHVKILELTLACDALFTWKTFQLKELALSQGVHVQLVEDKLKTLFIH